MFEEAVNSLSIVIFFWCGNRALVLIGTKGNAFQEVQLQKLIRQTHQNGLFGRLGGCGPMVSRFLDLRRGVLAIVSLLFDSLIHNHQFFLFENHATTLVSIVDGDEVWKPNTNPTHLLLNIL